MAKIVFFLFSFCLAFSAYSQNPISIDRVINELEWENCSESDVILTFKDNVVKREEEEEWDGGLVSSFILKNIKIGNYISDANIIVNKFNRKLIKIGGIIINNYDWSKGVDAASQELEDLFSSFWGKEHKKSIEYRIDYDDENNIYTDIDCKWGNSLHNETSSKGTFLLRQKAKMIVIAIEPK